MKAITEAISQPLHTNAMTKALPGTDASCARCHHHGDPTSQDAQTRPAARRSPRPPSPDCGWRAIAIVADMRPTPVGLHDICHATPRAASRSVGVRKHPLKEEDND